MELLLAINVNTNMRRTLNASYCVGTSNSFEAFVKQLTLTLFHFGAIELFRSHQAQTHTHNKHIVPANLS